MDTVTVRRCTGLVSCSFHPRLSGIAAMSRSLRTVLGFLLFVTVCYAARGRRHDENRSTAVRVQDGSGGHRRGSTSSELATGRGDPAQRGLKQTAWQVIVASSLEKLQADEGDLWNSSRTASDQSVNIEYAGQEPRRGAGVFLEGACVGPERPTVGLECTRPMDDGTVAPGRLASPVDRVRRCRQRRTAGQAVARASDVCRRQLDLDGRCAGGKPAGRTGLLSEGRAASD